MPPCNTNTPGIPGWILAPIALAALIAKPFIKPLIARCGYRRVLIWNTRLIGLPIISLTLPTADTPLILLIPLLFIRGLCNSLQYSTMNTLTIADLRPHDGNNLIKKTQKPKKIVIFYHKEALLAVKIHYAKHCCPE